MKPFPEYRDWIQRHGDSSMNITSGAYAAQREAYYRDAGALIPGEKQVGGIDANPHPSVQVWSRGELFPAVIGVIECYSDDWQGMENGQDVCINADVPLESRLKYRHYFLILDGVERGGYASREDAESVARGLLANPEARARWQILSDGGVA